MQKITLVVDFQKDLCCDALGFEGRFHPRGQLSYNKIRRGMRSSGYDIDLLLCITVMENIISRNNDS